MPVARLKPLPFLASRLTALLEEDPSPIEPGLRVAARKVPLPDAAGGGAFDLLAADEAGRAAGVRILERVEAGAVAWALGARAWLQTILPTLRAVCPALQGEGGETRCLLVGGVVDPAAVRLVEAISEGRIRLLEAALFESPAGAALSVRAVAGEAPSPRVSAPRAGAGAADLERPSAGPGADLLTGIPLTAEEAAEFRRIEVRGSDRAAPAASAGPKGTPRPLPPGGMTAPPPAALAERGAGVSRAGFVEN